MRDYKQGKIYTIRCKYDDSLIYVGSTVEHLCVRMARHRGKSKRDECINIPLYQEVNKTNWDDWYIELYEDCPCESKAQLNRREGEVIREIGTLNKVIAGRTKQEYHRENTEKIHEKKKQYYRDNFEKINEKNKQYNRENAEKLKEYFKQYRQENAAKINEYKRANAERIKEWKKEYCRENAAKLHKYTSELITCQCGSVIARGGYARHTRTNKHIEKMKKND